VSASRFPVTIVPEAGLATAKFAMEGSDGTKGHHVYRRGAWTPSITFATPGDQSIAYSRQVGRYIRIGDLVHIRFGVITSTFTHATASGALSMGTLPFAARTITNDVTYGSVSWAGITKANYTNVMPFIASAGTTLGFALSGSGQAAATLSSGDMPSGGTVVLLGTIEYEAAAL
jgi:hypothetical protein